MHRVERLGDPTDHEDAEFIATRSMSKFKVRVSYQQSMAKFLTSSLILKWFSMAFGLRPHRSRTRVILALIFLIPDAYNLLQTITYGFVCPSARSALDGWFCGNETRNISSFANDVLPFRMNKADLLDFVLKLSQLFSHLTFLWSVWMFSKKENVVRQEYTSTLVKPNQWLKLNCKIFLFFVALSSSTLWLIIENRTASSSFLVASAIYPIPLWASLLTCWIFGSLTSSMETLTSNLYDDITKSTCLDDIIKLHQKLCGTIVATSDAFKIWFMIHWALYTVLSVVWVANFVFYYSLLSQSPSSYLSGTVYLFIYVYVFIYPCFCAASLTAKCQQLLVDFNMKFEDEWDEAHPFRQRQNLHLFLKYASYANCGYKVGSITFGSMSVFFSTLLAIVGAGLKVF